MSMAQMQPMYITTYHTVCDSNNNCHQESKQEYNWQRQHMINAAQSEIDDAQREIRRAQQEIREAEDEIRKARREIEVANGQISDANTLLGILPSYEGTLTAVNSENFERMVPAVKAQLEQMKRLSHIAKLDLNLKHQSQLVGNMETRPERPDGWQIPDSLVQY
jgi:chromosome segregation ATPase